MASLCLNELISKARLNNSIHVPRTTRNCMVQEDFHLLVIERATEFRMFFANFTICDQGRFQVLWRGQHEFHDRFGHSATRYFKMLLRPGYTLKQYMHNGNCFEKKSIIYSVYMLFQFLLTHLGPNKMAHILTMTF